MLLFPGTGTLIRQRTHLFRGRPPLCPRDGYPTSRDVYPITGGRVPLFRVTDTTWWDGYTFSEGHVPHFRGTGTHLPKDWKPFSDGPVRNYCRTGTPFPREGGAFADGRDEFTDGWVPFSVGRICPFYKGRVPLCRWTGTRFSKDGYPFGRWTGTAFPRDGGPFP